MLSLAIKAGEFDLYVGFSTIFDTRRAQLRSCCRHLHSTAYFFFFFDCTICSLELLCAQGRTRSRPSRILVDRVGIKGYELLPLPI
ncbi:hypothetical protein LX36DRAFT_266180 [Colletotrichum falcatum]|nr:hypothetical protein LX36DRAFT_266180 [Colletotrichum falcatum]